MRNKYGVYQHQFNFQFDKDLKKAKFDRTLILLAAQNLISNSLRYANSQIKIQFTRCHNHVELSVEDDGPGIENHEEVTLMFKRGEQEIDSNTGFGLGLYIVQSVAIKHQGEFCIERSESLHGAKMTLRWPQ